MSQKPKLIADIRYYESPDRSVFGNVRHQTIGSIFPVPFRSFSDIGDRFACKLRELGFKFLGFDHLYVILTPALPNRAAKLCDISSDSRTRYADVGLDPQHWNGLDAAAKHDLLVDLTTVGVTEASSSKHFELVDEVSRLLKEKKSELEIKLKSKETSAYKIEVSFQITPRQGPSLAYVTYTDKVSGFANRAILTKLYLADDIYKLCGSITLNDQVITVSPRKSFRASMVAERYKTPLTITTADFLATPHS